MKYLLVLAVAVAITYPSAGAKKVRPYACEQGVCLVDLKWDRWRGDSIQGILRNGTPLTLETVSLIFTLKSRDRIVSDALAVSLSPIPAGAEWSFRAPVVRAGSMANTVTIQVVITKDGQRVTGRSTVPFSAPVFNPRDKGERKYWRKRQKSAAR